MNLRLAFVAMISCCLAVWGLVALLQPNKTLADEDNPDAIFAAFPNTQLTYYPVDGVDAATIRASMNAHRPVGSSDGGSYDARSNWHIDWRWPNKADGECDLSRVTVRFRATVILPRLADDHALAPDTAAAWRAYLRGVYRHEAGHLRLDYGAVANVANDVRSSDCAHANQAGHAALDILRRQNVEYDAATRHGATQGAIFPPPKLADSLP